jgi:phage FluMu protein Com
MPIRFRCAYCNQLLGIARRKAGSVVKCPTCSGQVVVPTLEEAGEVAEQRPAVNPVLFEGNEIDRMLEGAGGDMPSVLGGPPLPPPAPPAPAGHPAPVARFAPAIPSPAFAPSPTGGIYLSPTRATLWSVGLVLALAVAFGGGLLAGMYIEYHRLHPGP